AIASRQSLIGSSPPSRYASSAVTRRARARLPRASRRDNSTSCTTPDTPSSNQPLPQEVGFYAPERRCSPVLISQISETCRALRSSMLAKQGGSDEGLQRPRSTQSCQPKTGCSEA